MTDTVGFIRKLPHQLVDAFAATLEETRLADLRAARRRRERARGGARAEMTRAVEDVLEEIHAGDSPRMLVLNKADLLDDERRRELSFRHPDAVLVSAVTGEGLDELRRADRRRVRAHAARRRAARAVLRGRDAVGAARRRRRHGAHGHARRRAASRARLPAVVAERFDRYAVNGR